MTIIVISNYRKDRQESMVRFAAMLHKGYKSKGLNVIKVRPLIILGFFFHQTTHGAGKWFSYADKWIFTPFLLMKIRLQYSFQSDVFYHIADHSNSPYLFWLPKNKTLITCHDVLAIRGSLGFKELRCDASWTGVLYQRWIKRNLLKSKNIAAVSSTTLQQLTSLDSSSRYKNYNWHVVFNGLNASFYRPEEDFIVMMLKRTNIEIGKPFLLHVGSGHARKNRVMLVKMLLELGDEYNGCVVFAGKQADKALNDYINENRLNNRVHFIINPGNGLLLALYAACDAFIFPSWSEGFGWPVIEAQACGAPVIVSNKLPMPEVAGEGALYADPDSPAQFAESFKKLFNKNFRFDLIEKGYKNTTRFSSSKMINEYLDFFNKIRKK
ncbi:MAG: glycosyltransferase family 4 protein [Ferruginibacter sp.]|nr:glycosyltransferase family 4 protein [Ferruginibacter sp.]